jgi:glycosyltransferase involved in cell wall biosynthesis
MKKSKAEECKAPIISVVTVVWNDVSGLKRTFGSIRKQVSYGFEYFVIDGSSTDGTQDLAKDNQDIIDVFISEPDSGIYEAMNKALCLFTGRYVLFLNAGDELYDESVLQKVTDKISTLGFPEKLIFGNAKIIDNYGYSWLYPPRSVVEKKRLEKWIKRNYPNHQSCFFPSDFAKTNHYDSGKSISADSEVKKKAMDSIGYEHVDVNVCNFYYGGISTKLSFDNMATLIRERKDRGEFKFGHLDAAFIYLRAFISLSVNILLGKRSNYVIQKIKNTLY